MSPLRDAKCTLLAVILFVSSWNIPLISGHVALTYPPARKYDLDFLDNSRTKGPCGMPKGKFQGKLPPTLYHLSRNKSF